MAKLTFRTAFDGDSSKFVSESGSKYLDQYAFKFDDNGEVIASTLHKIDDPINVFEKIQADYPSTDINLLMQRFALGDSSAIDVKDGIYADVTKMPKTFAEMFQRYNECERLFVELPADVKALFNNSMEEFWFEYGSDEFNKKINEYNDRFVDHSFDGDPYAPEESEVGSDE